MSYYNNGGNVGGGGGVPSPYHRPPPSVPSHQPYPNLPPPPSATGHHQAHPFPPSHPNLPKGAQRLPSTVNTSAFFSSPSSAPAPAAASPSVLAPSPPSSVTSPHIFLSKVQHISPADALHVLRALQESALPLEVAIETLHRRCHEEQQGVNTTIYQESEDEFVVVKEKTKKNYQPGLYFVNDKKTGTSSSSSSSTYVAKGAGPPAKIALPPLPSKAPFKHQTSSSSSSAFPVSSSSSSAFPSSSPRHPYEEEGSKFNPQEQSETLAMLTEERFIYHHGKGAIGNIAPVGMDGIRYVDDCFEFLEDGTYIFEMFTGSEGREEEARMLLRWRGTFHVDSNAKRTVVLRWDTFDMNIDTSTYNSRELKELSQRYGRLIVGVDRTLRSPTDPNAIFV